MFIPEELKHLLYVKQNTTIAAFYSDTIFPR